MGSDVSRSGRWRYTVKVQSLVDESVSTLHGMYFTAEQATAKAAQWQRVLDKRYGSDRVTTMAVLLYSDSAEDRDRFWS